MDVSHGHTQSEDLLRSPTQISGSSSLQHQAPASPYATLVNIAESRSTNLGVGTRGAKRPNSLQVRSQPRAIRRPCALSTARSDSAHASPISTTSPKAFSAKANLFPSDSHSSCPILTTSSPSNSHLFCGQCILQTDLMHSQTNDPWLPISHSEVGSRAPLWPPDSSSCTSCMLCSTAFTFARRRHHCRACGRLLCAACCSRRIHLPFLRKLRFRSPALEPLTSYARNRPHSLFQHQPSRVCTNCYKLLSSTAPPAKRIRSVWTADELKSYCAPTENATSCISPVVTRVERDFEQELHANMFGPSTFNAQQSYSSRCDPLLFQILPFIPKADAEGASPTVLWPPLVVGSRSELVLQHAPSTSLLTSSLFPENKLPTNEPKQNIQHCAPGTAMESLDRSPAAAITFAVTRNVHVLVHPVSLACCCNQNAWLFCSHGFDALGQEELVLLVRQRPNEKLPPIEIYRFYQQFYLQVIGESPNPLDNSTVILDPACPSLRVGTNRKLFYPLDYLFVDLQSEMCVSEVPNPDALPANGFVPCANDWIGCVFFRPTHQCLESLYLPSTPFLFGLLVLKEEAYWACHLPLRLLLGLGKSTRQYPHPLLSDRDRSPLFGLDPLPTSILELLCDVPSTVSNDPLPCLLRLADACVYLSVEPVEHASASTSDSNILLNISIPRLLQSRLRVSLDSLSLLGCNSFVLAGGLHLGADSHLVCVQSTRIVASQVTSTDTHKSTSVSSPSTVPSRAQSIYTTEAISIANTNRQITGVVFVAFSSGAPDQPLTLRIIEDGLVVQMSPGAFDQFVARLKRGESIRETPQSYRSGTSAKNELSELHENAAFGFSVHWIEEVELTFGEPLASQRVSWIDTQPLHPTGTYLVPLHYQLAHWLNADARRPSSCQETRPPAIAWSRVHLLRPFSLLVEDNHLGLPFSWAPLADDAAGALVQCLRSCAAQLRSHNHTGVSLRIRLQPPSRVGYQVSSVISDPRLADSACSDHMPIDDVSSFSCELDSTLLPILQRWVRQIHCRSLVKDISAPTQSGPIFELELDFCILD